MKKIIAVLLILALPLIWGCANDKTIDGVRYERYGLLDKDDLKDEAIEYRLVWGNLIWAGLFIETIIAPIYFFGFAIWEPVGLKEID
jgi:hypothetical protein